MKEYEESENENEKKILKHFNFLNDEINFQKIYGEYNFEKEKIKLTEIWENIIKYLFEEISHRLTLSLEEIKSLSIIHGYEPKGLDNILKYLRANLKYITQKDIKSDEFYKKNFPEIYPKPPKSYIIPIPNPFKLLNPFNLCREEKNEINDIECVRKDISYNDNIPEGSILFNYEILNSHCEALLMILNKILLENGQEIIKKDIAFKNIKENYSDNSKEGNIKLRYGTQNLEDVIYFLQKTKKIIIFEIEIKGEKYEFIKTTKNKDDTIDEKDKRIAKILISIDDKRGESNIIQEYIVKCLILAKKNLKDNNKDKAKEIIIKHNKLQKLLDKRIKLMKSLEKKIIDIQSGSNFVDEEEEKDNNKDQYNIICTNIDKIFEKEIEIVEENDYENEEINLELQKLIKEVSENKKFKSKNK
jgi:hypothetical protein